jgi:hypothetical protein
MNTFVNNTIIDGSKLDENFTELTDVFGDGTSSIITVNASCAAATIGNLSATTVVATSSTIVEENTELHTNDYTRVNNLTLNKSEWLIDGTGEITPTTSFVVLDSTNNAYVNVINPNIVGLTNKCIMIFMKKTGTPDITIDNNAGINMTNAITLTEGSIAMFVLDGSFKLLMYRA